MFGTPGRMSDKQTPVPDVKMEKEVHTIKEEIQAAV